MRVNVWIPDELVATLRVELPELNVSAVLREALRGLLQCRHDALLSCSTCAAKVEPGAIRLEARRSMYEEIYRRLAELIPVGGTAEGAGRIVNNVAERFGVAIWPEVRATRAEREAMRDAG